MNKMENTVGQKYLCDLVKKDYLETHFTEYSEMVRKGKYLCKKCGRIGIDKAMLCKAERLTKKK